MEISDVLKGQSTRPKHSSMISHGSISYTPIRNNVQSLKKKDFFVYLYMYYLQTQEPKALVIYKQTILPILDSVSMLVNCSSQKKIDKLQPLQNRAIRIINKLSGYVSTEEMKGYHKMLNLKTLSERRKLFMLILIYKFSKDEENVNRYRPEITLRTRPKVKMKLAFTDKERVLRSPYYMCYRLWDKLDSTIQLSK